MRERSLSLVALICLAALPAAADERDTVRTLRQTFPTAGIERIELDLPVGEARITGEDRGDVQVDFELRCKPGKERCAEAARRVTLESSSRHGELALDLRGFDRGQRRDLVLRGVVRIPAELDLGVDMGVGELEISGLAGNIGAELGVGEMTLRLPIDTARSVSLDTGVGETNLHLPDGMHAGERSGFVGGKTSWEHGTGQAVIRADVGVGEINARLE
ncbi:MAG: hypothetical protein ACRD2Z_08790 [Thermoanaerobaculia bacterium]